MIYGAGGMCNECAWIADSNLFGLVLNFFYDDDRTISSCNGYQILASLNSLYAFLISVPEPLAGQQIVLKPKDKYMYCNLISNSARLHENSNMGNGCIIGFDNNIGAVVLPNRSIGKCSRIGAGAVIKKGYST